MVYKYIVSSAILLKNLLKFVKYFQFYFLNFSNASIKTFGFSELSRKVSKK